MTIRIRMRMRLFLFTLTLIGGVLLGLVISSPSLVKAANQVDAKLALEPTFTPVPTLSKASTPSDDQVNSVAKQLYCPVCENIPLDVCPTQACAQWRDLIRQKLAAGWSADQIKTYFAAQYGDRVLAEPPRQGPNQVVNSMFYVLIGLSILGGVIVLVRVLSGERKSVPVRPPEVNGVPPSETYVSRIEEDLRRLK